MLKLGLPLKNQILLIDQQSMTLLNCDSLGATKPLRMDMWLSLDGEFLLLGLFSVFLERVWPWRSVGVFFLDLITGTKLRHHCGLLLDSTDF